MKEAFSCLLNQLIETTNPNIDYSSYKDLALICPFCDKPVFYRDRSISLNRAPAFVHFKAIPGDENCEARALTPKGKRYLKLMRPVAKEQRIEAFHQRILSLLGCPKSLTYRNVAKQLRKNHLNGVCIYDRFAELTHRTTALFDDPEFYENRLEDIKSLAVTFHKGLELTPEQLELIDGYKIFFPEIENHIVETGGKIRMSPIRNYDTELDEKLNREITVEVFDFLVSNRHDLKLWLPLIFYTSSEVGGYIERMEMTLGTSRTTEEAIIDLILHTIARRRWDRDAENLRARAKGFG